MTLKNISLLKKIRYKGHLESFLKTIFYHKCSIIMPFQSQQICSYTRLDEYRPISSKIYYRLSVNWILGFNYKNVV
jgi:hypothetical protein